MKVLYSKQASCHDVVLQPQGGIATTLVWALPRSLATTRGIIVYFLFLEVLRCFSSLRSPHTFVWWLSFRQPGCPIRKSMDQSLFAATHGLSQLITSFIASVSLGIRHTLFLTFLRFSVPLAPYGTHEHSLILSAVILLKLIQLKVLLTVLLVSICQRSFEDFFQTTTRLNV